MSNQNKYYRQVQLLVRMLPAIAEEPCFALKGGTAINLFLHDLPRLSVDIDLTYVPVQPRVQSLQSITAALARIAATLSKTIPDAKQESSSSGKLVYRLGHALVKIEVNEVLRGVVHPVQTLTVSERTENEFGYAEMQVVSIHDLYAGKICAALDRQHPRDLFDIWNFLEKNSFTNEFLETFLIYLISLNRPIVEVLFPNIRDISGEYQNEFLSMTEHSLPLKNLEKVRERLLSQVQTGLTDKHKDFLISFKSGEPQWSLLSLEGVEHLPAVQWKMHNLKQMTQSGHAKALDKLVKKLRQ